MPHRHATTSPGSIISYKIDLCHSAFHLTNPLMAGAYPCILLLLLLVSAAQLGLTAFLISCFDENGWPGQRESGPLIVKAMYIHLFTSVFLWVCAILLTVTQYILNPHRFWLDYAVLGIVRRIRSRNEPILHWSGPLRVAICHHPPLGTR